MKLKIQGKLLLYILTTAIVIYSITFTYMFSAMNRSARENAIQISEQISEQYSSEIEQKFIADFKIANALKNSCLKYPKLSYSERIKIFDPALKETVLHNSDYMSVWYTWELSSIYDNYLLSYGRTRISYFRQETTQGFMRDSLDLDGDKLNSTYYKLKINPQEIIVNPYYDNYTKKSEDDILMTTIAVPIYLKGKFSGLVGIDMALSQIQDISQRVIPSNKYNSFIISGDDKFLAFSNKKILNQPISVYFNQEEAENISEQKNNFSGKFSFYTKKDNKEFFVTIIPITFGKSITPWAVGIMTPVTNIMSNVKSISYIFILVSMLGTIAMIIVIWIFSKKVAEPLKNTAKVINNIAQGNISTSQLMEIKSYDEIADIGHSVNQLILSINKTANFAVEIGKGNLGFEYKPLSDDDMLGNSLLEMRKSLNEAKTEEVKRKEEDRKLNWATVGTAKFAEIMRQYSDNLESLAYAVISELVKYIDVNQGGLFIINEDAKKNKYIDLLASYAFDKRKMLVKRIPYGVGLVGRCILEHEAIYMTNIPQEYINITSGLGENSPKQLLIVPLIFNNQVYGAVELASFTQIEKYQRDFVELIGEVIASTISMVKINLQTSTLLKETKLRSEEMLAQEEEIRQNMEEMKSSQEELNLKYSEISDVLDAVKVASYIVEFDMQGRIIDINDKFLKLLKKEKHEMVGKFQGSFSIDYQNIEDFNKLWARLQSGHVREFRQEVFVGDKKLRIKSIYVPLLNENGEAYKVVSVGEVEFV